MTLSQIGRIQYWLAAIYSIPLAPLSLVLALMTAGLALLVFIPLWWAGITLMQAQDAADEHNHPGLWWCSLAYHGLPLIGLTAWVWVGVRPTSLLWDQILAISTFGLRGGVLPTSASGYVHMAAIFLSPLLGTLLSLLALGKVRFRMTAQAA